MSTTEVRTRREGQGRSASAHTPEQIIQKLREAEVELALRRAAQAGADRPQVQVQVQQRQGHIADGQEALVEVRLEAIAVGRPVAPAGAPT